MIEMGNWVPSSPCVARLWVLGEFHGAQGAKGCRIVQMVWVALIDYRRNRVAEDAGCEAGAKVREEGHDS